MLCMDMLFILLLSLAAAASCAFGVKWAKGVEARLADLTTKVGTLIETVASSQAAYERDSYDVDRLMTEIFDGKHEAGAGVCLTRDEMKQKIKSYNAKVTELWKKRVSNDTPKGGNDWIAGSTEAGADLRMMMRQYKPQSRVPLFASDDERRDQAVGKTYAMPEHVSHHIVENASKTE